MTETKYRMGATDVIFELYSSKIVIVDILKS